MDDVAGVVGEVEKGLVGRRLAAGPDQRRNGIARQSGKTWARSLADHIVSGNEKNTAFLKLCQSLG